MFVCGVILLEVWVQVIGCTRCGGCSGAACLGLVFKGLRNFVGFCSYLWWGFAG